MKDTQVNTLVLSLFVFLVLLAVGAACLAPYLSKSPDLEPTIPQYSYREGIKQLIREDRARIAELEARVLELEKTIKNTLPTK